MEETEKQKSKLTWRRFVVMVVLIAITAPLYYGFFLITALFVGTATNNGALGIFAGLLPLLIFLVVVSLAEYFKKKTKKENVQERIL